MTVIFATEADIQKACLDWLNTVPGVIAWRQNTGVVVSDYTSKRTGSTKKRVTRFGQRGQADITGIGPGGLRLEIEIKKSGQQPSAVQAQWLQMIGQSGGIAFWCTSLGSCVSQLRAQFRLRGFRWSEEWEA